MLETNNALRVSDITVQDDNASQWKNGENSTLVSPKSLNRQSPKFAWVITSGTPTYAKFYHDMTIPF